MTPIEVAAKLRAFNEWRRGDEDIPQFDPREISEAIDAAIEMSDRLEASEKELAELRSSMKFRTSLIGRTEAERDALRAKIVEMERQEPARLVTPTAYRWRRRGCVMWQYGELTEETARLAKEHNHEVQSLYALPGAQPEPSIPPELEPNGMYDSSHHYASGWNDCREAMLAAAPKPEGE